MEYRVNVNDFSTALALDKSQVHKLNEAIQNALNKGDSIDQINALVAPDITTPEEGFYAATFLAILTARKGSSRR